MEPAFQDLKLNRQLLNAISDAGFTAPTPIQQKAIVPILSGQQVMGIAQTGTGKTAAYVLPVLKLLSHAQEIAPRAAIILPTRELAAQIFDSVKLFSRYTDLRIAVAYGGTSIKNQISEIEKGIDMIVATPGRFLELYSTENLVLKKIKIFVLDEADKLMDMGFMPQINRMLEVLPRKRQNLLFSATMNEKVQRLAQNFIAFPYIINIQPHQKTAATVSQLVYFVPNFITKFNLLSFLLKNDKVRKAIVFCKTKNTATALYEKLKMNIGEANIRLIHGNKQQQFRINAINAFRNEDISLLITTDVAARGLDVPNVSHVINFDVPLIYDDYVHRIGRTGRAFNTGSSVTFCSPDGEYHLRKIEKLIGQRIPVKEIPPEVVIEETPYGEKQLMAREIDEQHKKENPEFKGAFHEKQNSKNRKRASKHKKNQN